VAVQLGSMAQPVGQPPSGPEAVYIPIPGGPHVVQPIAQRSHQRLSQGEARALGLPSPSSLPEGHRDPSGCYTVIHEMCRPCISVGFVVTSICSAILGGALTYVGYAPRISDQHGNSALDTSQCQVAGPILLTSGLSGFCLFLFTPDCRRTYWVRG
jgi:hypothetical protein